MSAVIIISGGLQDDNIVSVGRDGVMKIYSIQTGKLVRSVNLSPVPLCSCVCYQTSTNSNVLVTGSSDNSLYVL